MNELINERSLEVTVLNQSLVMTTSSRNSFLVCRPTVIQIIRVGTYPPEARFGAIPISVFPYTFAVVKVNCESDDLVSGYILWQVWFFQILDFLLSELELQSFHSFVNPLLRTQTQHRIRPF